MEKQIEEMAEIICDNFENGMCKMYYHCKHKCGHINTAKSLYNAGYRKQSEGEWIKHTDEYDCEYFECSACNSEFYPPSCEFTFDMIPKYCQECGAHMSGGNNDE